MTHKQSETVNTKNQLKSVVRTLHCSLPVANGTREESKNERDIRLAPKWRMCENHLRKYQREKVQDTPQP